MTKKRLELSIEGLQAALIPGKSITIQGSFYFENEDDSHAFLKNFPYKPTDFKYGLYFEEKDYWIVECTNKDCETGIEKYSKEPTEKDCGVCGSPLTIEKVE